MGVIFGTVSQLGYGYGYGYGYGDGYGDGYGYGYGYGYGDGYGSGYGYGSGDKEYLEAILCANVLDAKGREAKGQVLAFWRSGKDGQPANGGSGESARVGLIQAESGPLVPCAKGALHATMQPPKWKGERLWIVALYPPVKKVDDDKYASLKREILAEIPNFYK